MAIVNGSLQVGKKDSAFFSANPTLVLLDGQLIYNETTGDLFIGDGVTQLSSLTAINGGGAGVWGSITGTLSNQTDLQTALNTKVNKGTLTSGYVPKATASDTIGDSQIIDDGANGIQVNRYVKNSGALNNYLDLNRNTGSALVSDTIVENYAPIIYHSTAGDHFVRLESTGRKLYLRGDELNFFQSANAIGNAFNVNSSGNDTVAYFYSALGLTKLAIGKQTATEALDVVGDVVISGLTASKIIETNANKKLVSSSYAVSDLLVASNNLSDLSNPITARTNLKEWQLYMTTGDQSTTSNVASNITDLVTPTLTANKRYRIHGVIHIGCNNTGGIKIQITGPTGTTMWVDVTGSGTSGTVVAKNFLNTNATLMTSTLCAFNGTNAAVFLHGEVVLAGTAGTIQIGFASGTNTQTTTAYQLGTQLTVTQVD